MASISKFEQKAYITLLGFGLKEILVDLEFVYRGASLSYTTVKEWDRQFRIQLLMSPRSPQNEEASLFPVLGQNMLIQQQI